MLHINTESSVQPEKVTMETLGDGTKHVILADNIHQEDRGEENGSVWVYNEVAFDLEPEREETAADIEAEFEGWWEYGAQGEEAAPTIEDRVAAIEEYLLGGV